MPSSSSVLPLQSISGGFGPLAVLPGALVALGAGEDACVVGFVLGLGGGLELDLALVSICFWLELGLVVGLGEEAAGAAALWFAGGDACRRDLRIAKRLPGLAGRKHSLVVAFGSASATHITVLVMTKGGSSGATLKTPLMVTVELVLLEMFRQVQLLLMVLLSDASL
jgi:hypothetical protein